MLFVKSIILGFGIRNTATCKLIQNAAINNIGIRIQVPLTKNAVAGIWNPLSGIQTPRLSWIPLLEENSPIILYILEWVLGIFPGFHRDGVNNRIIFSHIFSFTITVMHQSNPAAPMPLLGWQDGQMPHSSPGGRGMGAAGIDRCINYARKVLWALKMLNPSFLILESQDDNWKHIWKNYKLTKLQVVTLWYIAKIAALSQYQLQLLP